MPILRWRRKTAKKGSELLKNAIFEEKTPETLEEALEKYPYLATYLEGLDKKPKFVKNLESGFKFEEDNVLYPLGLGIFIHVSLGKEVGKYNIIEPEKPDKSVLAKVEEAIASLLDEKVDIREENRREVLVELFWRAMKKRRVRIPKGEEVKVLYHFLREKIGHGFLDAFLADPWLEDISIPGEGKIFVYHKFFGSLETNLEVSKGEIDQFLRSLAERYGKVLSFSHPIIDIHLPDGSRLNIVFGEDISLKGSNFTIRKFSKEPVSIAHLIAWNTLSAEMAAYLWMLLEVGISCLFCGETAAGKTTCLNAAACFIKPDAKVVSIEETPEVNIPHKNWVREITRLHTGSEVTMFDLLKAALRQRPDYIIVGEIRGEEGRIAFQAIETGHPVLSTMHAGDLQQLFQRLTSHPILVPKTHIDGLNLAVFLNRIKRGKRLVRRVTAVNEIIRYDARKGSLNFLPVFVYSPDEDRLNFIGSSFLMEMRVLPYRGWDKGRVAELYEEMRVRAEILRYLSEHYPRYSHVWKTVVEAENRGVRWVYERVMRGETPWLG